MLYLTSLSRIHASSAITLTFDRVRPTVSSLPPTCKNVSSQRMHTLFGITLTIVGGILWIGNVSGIFPTIPYVGYMLIGVGVSLHRMGAVAAARSLRRTIRETPSIPAVELEPNEELPGICVRCGEPAKSLVAWRYVGMSEKSEEPHEESISLPVCAVHLAAPTSPAEFQITAADRRVLIVNVSRNFARAVREQQRQRLLALGNTMSSLASNYESPEDFLRNLER